MAGDFGRSCEGRCALENVIRSSYLSAGEGLKPALRRLIARLNASESTERALDAFAQDLADPTIDQVVYLLRFSPRARGWPVGVFEGH